MTLGPFIVFGIAFLITFVGTLPFGPINLSVVDTSINRSFKGALEFSIAAAIVEILQSFVALHCSYLIGGLFSESLVTKIIGIIVFFSLGLIFWLKKPKSQLEETCKESKRGNYLRGFIISIVNFQAIPFWIFVLTYLEMSKMIVLNTSMPLTLVIVFLLGVLLGKFAGLALFAVIGRTLKQRIASINKMMNKIIGGFLFLIGVVQLVQLLI